MTTRIAVIWAATRLFVLGASVVGSWTVMAHGGFLHGIEQLWTQWDTNFFTSIATGGYGNPDLQTVRLEDDAQYNVAFFPGLPMLMRIGGLVGLSPVMAGILVSLIASLLAAFALGRLAEQVGARAEWTVAAWLVAPTAVFLFAPYTEALFAALAFWAWVKARQDAWIAAGVLAGLAALVRSNGLFLAAALILMFLLSPRRDWRTAPALLLPFVATLGYFAYLHSITGSWTTWFDVQRVRWDRMLTDPLTSLLNTIDMVSTFTGTGAISSRFVSELAAMALLIVVCVILLIKRWWAEAAYVVVTVAALGTSTWYYSVPRTIVVLFPVWMLLGLWLTRYRWLRWAYLLTALPMLALVVVRFTQGQWIS